MEHDKSLLMGAHSPFSGSVNDATIKKTFHPHLLVQNESGEYEPLDFARIRATIEWARRGYEAVVSVDAIIEETLKNMFDKISTDKIEDALVLGSIVFIERDPAYGAVAARLLRRKLFKNVTGKSITDADMRTAYKKAFVDGIVHAVQHELLDARMLDYDLEALADAMKIEHDDLFDYMGMKTLYERYFLRHGEKQLENPQAFWMRVAMGLCYNEVNKTERVLEFYSLMSSLNYVPSTPTLLHAGLTRPQLSSCFLSTVTDDLKDIFKCLGDIAQMSKWSGGVASDWTDIRATGAMIKSIKVESQGVVPFLKIANDVTAAINRSGRRRSATCVYLETWHFDIEDFLDLKKNTGDERRRTHDINTANWIPDLFMKRVMEDGNWTLFSPNEVSDLHHIYGKEFEERYAYYEAAAARGEIEKFKVIEAKKLWRKMLSRLFETGHPWITFKDACNIRSPQDHAGVVHCSNLCTEITLNNSADETAVCNLGSVNLALHIVDGKLDVKTLEKTVTSAVRMLDNVIDINFYPTQETENANLRHRPIGLGVMGFQDALYHQNIAFDDAAALEFADVSQEYVSYFAIKASAQLAKERGTYQSYKGSKWDRGIFPVDTLNLLEQERGMKVEVNRTERIDWSDVRAMVKQYGMRNSNTMAIAPTATISNIAGCFPCIEAPYKNIYVKANMSGEFTVVNKYLIEDLKACGLWDKDMLDEIKYFDGNVQKIARIPANLKAKYKEAFEIDPLWLVHVTAARGKWIDQSQSHNVFLQGVSGQKLSEIYFAGWQAGMKTFYYLRSLGASQIEKSTLDAKKFGFTQKRDYTALPDQAEQAQAAFVQAAPAEQVPAAEAPAKAACSISADPECDVCQ